MATPASYHKFKAKPVDNAFIDRGERSGNMKRQRTYWKKKMYMGESKKEKPFFPDLPPEERKEVFRTAASFPLQRAKQDNIARNKEAFDYFRAGSRIRSRDMMRTGHKKVKMADKESRKHMNRTRRKVSQWYKQLDAQGTFQEALIEMILEQVLGEGKKKKKEVRSGQGRSLLDRGAEALGDLELKLANTRLDIKDKLDSFLKKRKSASPSAPSLSGEDKKMLRSLGIKEAILEQIMGRPTVRPDNPQQRRQHTTALGNDSYRKALPPDDRRPTQRKPRSSNSVREAILRGIIEQDGGAPAGRGSAFNIQRGTPGTAARPGGGGYSPMQRDRGRGGGGVDTNRMAGGGRTRPISTGHAAGGRGVVSPQMSSQRIAARSRYGRSSSMGGGVSFNSGGSSGSFRGGTSTYGGRTHTSMGGGFNSGSASGYGGGYSRRGY